MCDFIFFSFLDALFEPLLHFFYFKPAKLFPHFYYIYNLTRKCKSRIDRMRKSKDQSEPMSKDVVIKIGIAGWFSKNNLELISERTGILIFFLYIKRLIIKLTCIFLSKDHETSEG